MSGRNFTIRRDVPSSLYPGEQFVRRSLIFAGFLALAGCGSERHGGNRTTADINAAAEAAQGDIDTYAANTLQSPTPVASPAAAHVQAVVASPVPVADGDAATDPDGASGTVAVVRHYHALIAAKDFGRAWRLWDDDGRSSGMTERRFADSFARYARYRAEVGTPGPVEVGAGQRYVEVPVRVTGTLTGRGGPFALAGPFTLHRVADIDGATPVQRQWRISKSALRPQRGDGADAAADATAKVYRCAGETRVTVRIDDAEDTATVRSGGQAVAVLEGQRPASGIWYKGGDYELRGEGNTADYTAPGRSPVPCSAE